MTKLKWAIIWKLEQSRLITALFEIWSNMLHISHFAVLPCSEILTILNCLRMKGCNGSSVTSKFYTNLYFWSLSMPLLIIGLLVLIYVASESDIRHVRLSLFSTTFQPWSCWLLKIPWRNLLHIICNGHRVADC